MQSDKPNWPEPVLIAEHKPSLNVGSLSPGEKQILWKHLKQHHPRRAKEISELMRDPVVLSLIDTFDASITVEEMYVPKSLSRLLS